MKKKLKLIDWITKELRKMSHIKIMFEPQTCIVGFRYDHSDLSKKELNLINHRVIDRINSHGWAH